MTERWREVGVTHWHLIEPREWNIDDKTRHDQQRVRAERVRSSAGVARSPQEVVKWMEATATKLFERHRLTQAQLRSSGIATVVDRRMREQTRLTMATLGLDVCALLAVGSTRIVHYNAYAMTANDCTAH